VEVRIRLGSGIARFASAPVLTLQLPNGATVEDIYDRLAASNAELVSALQSAVPIVGGVHVERGQALSHGDEVALLMPLSGG
jgi:MoaE-MoaD fusion protein